MKLIDKDALVAEIKKKKDICKKVVWDLRTQENQDYYQGKAEAYKEVLDLLDTLETKEVELEKEIDDAFLENKCNITDNVSLVEFERIAKHFFELGLKVAQKGE